MTTTILQNNKKKRKAPSLCHTVRGPYEIIHTTGYGTYLVYKLHRPDNPKLKFMAYDVYPLPHLFNLVNPLTQ